MKLPIHLRVNGQSYEEEAEARTLLVHFLREKLGLTGTHVGCVVGECGACSVMVDGALVKSCLMLAVQANGCEVTTVEGLAQRGKLHPIQEAFIHNFALQCGFCTPGMVMSACDLLRKNPSPTQAQIREWLDGNLCRCTGYNNIVAAISAAAPVLAKGAQGEGTL